MVSTVRGRELISYVTDFEAAAGRFGGKVALRDDHGGQLRFAELNQHANRLASYLSEVRGVKPGDLVAVRMKRCVSLATVLLAIWKCRAAYLLLDPAHSETRNRDLLDIVRPALLLGDGSDLSALAKAMAGDQVDLSAIEAELGARPGEDLKLAHDPRDKAYVFFTSGSTGKPKGAVVEQGGALNHMYAKLESTKMVQDEVMAQTSSLNFNIFNWQTFGPLLVGASVTICSDETARSPLLLAQRVAKERVNYMQIVPTLFGLLMEYVRHNRPLLSSLSMMLLTGEKPKTQDINNWFELYPGTPILNSYGCTEVADDSIHHILTGPVRPDDTVPVGRPIDNTTIRIVKTGPDGEVLHDVNGRPLLCETGDTGQIWISGDVVVGLGYVNNQEETDRYFATDPFSGERMFKIGDLGYRNDKGEIVCLGRADRQVKINGQRLDLAEIETQILASAVDIKDVVVLPHTAPSGRQFLTAIFRAERRYGIRELRGFNGILVHLPVHLIPHFWVQVGTMPVLSGSGKVDKARLKEIHSRAFGKGESTSFIRDEREFPSTDEEKLLARVWWEVLGLEELGVTQADVGINECFFNLGGDSIRAQDLGRKLEQAGYAINFDEFYRASAIKERSRYLRSL